MLQNPTYFGAKIQMFENWDIYGNFPESLLYNNIFFWFVIQEKMCQFWKEATERW